MNCRNLSATSKGVYCRVPVLEAHLRPAHAGVFIRLAQRRAARRELRRTPRALLHSRVSLLFLEELRKATQPLFDVSENLRSPPV